MSESPARRSFDPAIVRRAVLESFVKLNPRTLAKNPVMFVVGVGSLFTTILFFTDLSTDEATRTSSLDSSRCSSGSPCCSRTSRRPSRRVGEGPGGHAARAPRARRSRTSACRMGRRRTSRARIWTSTTWSW